MYEISAVLIDARSPAIRYNDVHDETTDIS